MKDNKEYELLMQKLSIKDIDVEEFKKAFDVTQLHLVRSYVNQKYAQVGQRALHLLYADLYYEEDTSERIEYLDSYENRIDICNYYNLLDYVYSNNISALFIGFVIKSTLFEAIAGIIFLIKSYEGLKEWYCSFSREYYTTINPCLSIKLG